MGIDPVSYNSLVTRLRSQNAEYDKLSTQLATGQVGATYAELGNQRSTALNIEAQLSDFDAYGQSATVANTRLSVAQTSIGNFVKIDAQQRSDNAIFPFVEASNGQSVQQISAAQRLDDIITQLNQDVDGRTLFSGRATDRPAAVQSQVILNGQGAQAGLKTVINERTRADSGSDGLGRLALSTIAGTTVSLSETASGPFGYKISSSGSSLSNVALTDVPGPPHSVSVAFSGLPNNQESINVAFTLPDGTTSTLTLTATSGTPGANQFQIGADPAATAANFSAALTSSLKTFTNTDLLPASTAAASDGFFNISASQAPQRVNVTSTPEAATSLRNGTSSDTVFWYTGDNATDNPRATATTRVDKSLSVGYGVRATEPAIRNLVSNIAAFAAVTFSSSDPKVQDKYQAVALKLRARLADTSQPTLEGLSTELAGVQTTIKDTTDRQKNTQNVLQNVLQGITGVDVNEVAVKLTSLQSQIQASYQTTATISKLNLVNYL